MDFTNFNKNQYSKIDWGIETKGFSFKKIRDIYSERKTVIVRGFFFTKSKDFGLQPIAILDDCLLNLPTHMKDSISEMLKNEDCVKAIKKGECGLSFREYMTKYNKNAFACDFTNIDKKEYQTPLF